MKKKLTKNELSWTPRRKGTRYCSPACGGGCTYSAYRKAKSQAERLARSLGPTWRPVVHENLGWHWRVENLNGNFQLHQHAPNSFWASFMAGGKQYQMHGVTAESTVLHVVAEVLEAGNDLLTSANTLRVRTNV